MDELYLSFFAVQSVFVFSIWRLQPAFGPVYRIWCSTILQPTKGIFGICTTSGYLHQGWLDLNQMI